MMSAVAVFAAIFGTIFIFICGATGLLVFLLRDGDDSPRRPQVPTTPAQEGGE